MVSIQENISLSKYTTFRIGGPARFFAEVNNEEELKEALEYAKNNSLEFFILGGGSNVLVSDEGFKGLVIKVNSSQFTVNGDNIDCDAGAPLAKAVREAANNNLSGLEWAIGIPGTVGGAIRGNAGAFGGDISSAVESVKVVEITNNQETISKQISNPNFQITNYSKVDCKFGYRDSIFKQNKNLIILSTVLELSPGKKEEIEAKIKENLSSRIAKNPIGFSAGSFFVNPVVNKQKLIEEFEKETGKKSKAGKVPAGWLINRADLRGKKIGGAQVSEKHSNFVINDGNATAQDVIVLANFVKQQVRDKFGVELYEEVQYIGF